MSEYTFDTLNVFQTIPDHKYDYVSCRFYKKNVNFSLYVRRDIRIYVNQIFRFKYENFDGFVSTKEIQMHPVSGRIIHMDFFIIEKTDSAIRMKMPLKFVNQDKCNTIKLGGFLYITSRQIEVKVGEAKNMLPYIPVDVSPFKSEQSIGLQHMEFPSGIVPVRSKLMVATVMPSKGAES